MWNTWNLLLALVYTPTRTYTVNRTRKIVIEQGDWEPSKKDFSWLTAAFWQNKIISQIIISGKYLNLTNSCLKVKGKGHCFIV